MIRGIENGQDCARVLQIAAAGRGAFASLVLELLEDHIETHIAGASQLLQARKEARALNGILRSYLK